MNNFEIINALKQIQLANRNKKLSITFGSIALAGLGVAVVYFLKYKETADDLLIYRNRYFNSLKENINKKHADSLNEETDNVTDSSNEFAKDEQI